MKNIEKIGQKLTEKLVKNQLTQSTRIAMISSSRETCNPGAASARHARLRGVESRGVDCGVDVTLGDATGQDRGRVQVSKSSGGGGVSQVICGNIDGLERYN